MLYEVITGCAEERPQVERVQPYALDKADFVGPDLTSAADHTEKCRPEKPLERAGARGGADPHGAARNNFV